MERIRVQPQVTHRKGNSPREGDWRQNSEGHCVLRRLNFILKARWSHLRIYGREMLRSDLHFRKFTQVAVKTETNKQKPEENGQASPEGPCL